MTARQLNLDDTADVMPLATPGNGEAGQSFGSAHGSESDSEYQKALDAGYAAARREHRRRIHYATGYVPSDPELNAAFLNGVTLYRDEHALPDDE